MYCVIGSAFLTDLFSRQDLRIQLTQERDAVRHISLQKEIEVKEMQGRLDKAVRTSSVSSISI
jgi:hypothetical protein